MATMIDTDFVDFPDQPAPPKRSWFVRLLIFLVVIIVLLGVVNLAIIGIRLLDRPGTPPPRALLYATTFDAFNDEWSQFDGQMSSKIQNGALVISIDSANDGAYSVLNHDFSDFDLRLTAERLATQDDYDEVAFLFGYQDPNNYYVFKLRNDGFYRVERRIAGATDILSEWHNSPAVLTGVNVINQVRITGQLSFYQFYVNNERLILCPKGPNTLKSTWNGDNCLSNNKQTSYRIFDDTFGFGKIGVGVRSNDSGSQVAFDNILVYGP